MADGASEAEIRFERRGSAGLIVLDRPRALNALTLAMIRAMQAQLEAWATDARVTRIVVRGEGGRAFCAGGDVREVYRNHRAGRHDLVDAFWRREYALDVFIKRYPKPCIALLEGVVMGGGLGIALHGSHRVSSETCQFAMPETGIGLFPDVGMTYALPRLPGRTGTYLALTGAKIGAGDALALGIATHHAKASDFPALIDALAEGGDIEGALASYAAPPPEPGPLVAARATIDACFSGDSVADVLARLDRAAGEGAAFAAEAAALMRTRAPFSLCLVHEQMRRGVDLDFTEAMLTEYRLATRIMRGHDFFEGVRALLIDKDGAPAWAPARVADVDAASVAAAFAPLEGEEPDFSGVTRG